MRQDPIGSVRLPIDVPWVLGKMSEGEFRRIAGKPTRRGYVNCGRELDAKAARNLDKTVDIKYRLLNAADALGQRPKMSDLQKVINSVVEEYPDAVANYGRIPALSTLRAWRCRYGTHGIRDYASCLRKGLKQPRNSRMHPEVVKIVIKEVIIYWAEKLKTIAGTCDDIRSRISEFRCTAPVKEEELSKKLLKCPNKETIRNWIYSFACWDTYFEKHGRAKADAFFKASGIGVKTSRILELCMIDHTVIDCIVVDDVTGVVLGRPVLTLIICAHSRVVFGWYIGFDMASFAAVSECLKSASRPKLGCALANEHPFLQDFYGKPHELIVDNGLEFVGSSFLDAATDMAINIRICPVKSPTYKAIVERVFGTLNEQGIHTFQGTTLNKQKALLDNTDYKAQPVYTLTQLRELFGMLLSAYHLKPHGGLGGQSPAYVWTRDALRHGLPVFDDVKALDTHVNIAADRKLRRHGISFECLRYTSSDVSVLMDDLFRAKRGKAASIDVKIKYNPLNLAEIHVFNPSKAAYATLRCVNQQYAADLSLYQHMKIKDFARGESLKFISDDDMLAARRRLRDAILAASPKLKTQANRALKRLFQSRRVQEVINLRVGPEVVSIVQHEALAQDRTDGGKRTPSVPRNNKRRQVGGGPLAALPEPPKPSAPQSSEADNSYFESNILFEGYDHE
jgi:putative transposase